jgi:hypothetical protein
MDYWHGLTHQNQELLPSGSIFSTASLTRQNAIRISGVSALV